MCVKGGLLIMKISNKEKIMLGILGVMLIGIGYYNYVYKDHTFKVQEKEDRKSVV